MTRRAPSACGGTYDDIAEEYYDSGRHPTAANFREASGLVLSEWLPAEADRRPIVEVGAGDSLVAETLADHGLPLDGLLITDKSPQMLEYSRKWTGCGARALPADACDLPVPDRSVGMAISVLGDPYNTEEFWREVGRVLAPGAICIYTTPSHAWSELFRERAAEPADCAEFVVGVRRVRVPSFIYRVDEQAALVRCAGLELGDVREVLVEELSGSVSEKLRPPSNGQGGIVTGYWIVKPASR